MRHGYCYLSMRWSTSGDLGCTLDGMAVVPAWRKVVLYFPRGEVCNMRGAIALAVKLFPKVARIETYSGEWPDVTYRRTGPDRWHSHRDFELCLCC